LLKDIISSTKTTRVILNDCRCKENIAKYSNSTKATGSITSPHHALVTDFQSRWNIVKQIKQRTEIPLLLDKLGLFGSSVECGVDNGYFSDFLLSKSSITTLYSVDMWAGDKHHDAAQYFAALTLLRKHSDRSIALRMTFNEALDIFDNGFFDFVYMDGYASQGSGGKKMLDMWWKKLKKGGIMAGHDYDPHWPKTVNAVHTFARQNKLEFHLTDHDTEMKHDTSSPNVKKRHQSWLFLKDF